MAYIHRYNYTVCVCVCVLKREGRIERVLLLKTQYLGWAIFWPYLCPALSQSHSHTPVKVNAEGICRGHGGGCQCCHQADNCVCVCVCVCVGQRKFACVCVRGRERERVREKPCTQRLHNITSTKSRLHITFDSFLH